MDAMRYYRNNAVRQIREALVASAAGMLHREESEAEQWAAFKHILNVPEVNYPYGGACNNFFLPQIAVELLRDVNEGKLLPPEATLVGVTNYLRRADAAIKETIAAMAIMKEDKAVNIAALNDLTGRGFRCKQEKEIASRMLNDMIKRMQKEE